MPPRRMDDSDASAAARPRDRGVFRDARRDGPRLLAEPLHGLLLQRHIDSQDHVLARISVLPVELADHPPDRVHLEMAGTCASPQRQVEGPLDPAAPDPEPRQLKQRVAREVFRTWRTDISEDVCSRLSVGVEPALPDIDLDAGSAVVGGLTSTTFNTAASEYNRMLSIDTSRIQFGDSAMRGDWYLSIDRESLKFVRKIYESGVGVGSCKLVERDTSKNAF